MNIRAIAIFPSDNKNVLTVPSQVNDSFFSKAKKNKYELEMESKILPKIKSAATESKEIDVPLKIVGEEGLYFARIFPDKIAVFATDTQPAKESIFALLNDIPKATKASELALIMKNSEKYLETKLDKIERKIDEVRDVTLLNFDKLIERSDSLSRIKDAAKTLGDDAKGFHKKGKKEKRKQGVSYFFRKYLCCVPCFQDDKTSLLSL